MELYTNKSCDPKHNAQRNLTGRTHYVDDDTLRYHHARVLSSRHTDGGLLFALVESVALDPNNRKRGYRYVIFDVFGHTVSRSALEDCWKTSERATKEMWIELNRLNAKAITLEAIDREQQHFRDEMQRLCVEVAKIETVKAA